MFLLNHGSPLSSRHTRTVVESRCTIFYLFPPSRPVTISIPSSRHGRHLVAWHHILFPKSLLSGANVPFLQQTNSKNLRIFPFYITTSSLLGIIRGTGGRVALYLILFHRSITVHYDLFPTPAANASHIPSIHTPCSFHHYLSSNAESRRLVLIFGYIVRNWMPTWVVFDLIDLLLLTVTARSPDFYYARSASVLLVTTSYFEARPVPPLPPSHLQPYRPHVHKHLTSCELHIMKRRNRSYTLRMVSCSYTHFEALYWFRFPIVAHLRCSCSVPSLGRRTCDLSIRQDFAIRNQMLPWLRQAEFDGLQT